MKDMKTVLCVSLGALLLLSGCNLAPKYTRPKTPVPPRWSKPATEKAPAGAPAAAELKWQEFFTDEKLRQVIQMTLSNNRDLRIATLNIDKAQALYRIRRAQQYPTVTATASGNVMRFPKSFAFSGGEAQTFEMYNVGVGATSWELDLFGHVRNLKRQALEQYLATEQARSATQVALVGAVANSYLALAADREQLRLARATLKSQQATHDLIRRAREVGIASELDLRQAQTQVEAARVSVARYTALVAQDENALNLLVGAPVPTALLPGELDGAPVKEVSAGLSSEVLLRRPDILAAEHQLKAAYANIGAARAAFFPLISLTGSGGFMSSDFAELFKSGSGTWTFAPQLALPIFDGGSRKANLKAARVDRDIAIAQYEKAIQSAFREVSDALSLRAKLAEQLNAQRSLVNALENTYRLSEARYQAGTDSYLSVLVAQRSLYGARQALVSLRQAYLSNLVTLYKALGGGG